LATIRIDDDDFESGQVRFQITNLNVWLLHTWVDIPIPLYTWSQ
jgi:hypothetical protein